MVSTVTGAPPVPPTATPPAEPGAFLRYWIDNDEEPNRSALLGLNDFANSLRVAWERRHEPNVHLFHYEDLWKDLGGQVARVARILDVALDPLRHGAIVEAATLETMRSRAQDTAPYGVFPAGGAT